MGYNLGGRSVFWGGFTPRMRPYEFEAGAWPASVRDQLLGAGEDDANSWYAKAEALMKVGEPRPSQYQTRCKSWLSNLLGGNFDVFDAPMAVQRQTGERRTLSAGMFSTADLLFESRATNGQVGNQDLVINLHHSVRRLEFNGGQVTQVVAYDRLARQERKYAANKIVLAAGTLETARIARQSGLAGRDVSNKIGVGIVDHPIWFVHFGLPAGHELFAADASAKIVIQHKAPTVTEHGWNAILELGSDWNQVGCGTAKCGGRFRFGWAICGSSWYPFFLLRFLTLPVVLLSCLLSLFLGPRAAMWMTIFCKLTWKHADRTQCCASWCF